MNKEFQKNSSKLKRFISHTFFTQKKTREQKKERNMTEREKAEDVLSNLLDEKQHFFRYITTGKQKMHAHALPINCVESKIFQDTENKTKQEKM